MTNEMMEMLAAILKDAFYQIHWGNPMKARGYLQISLNCRPDAESLRDFLEILSRYHSENCEGDPSIFFSEHESEINEALFGEEYARDERMRKLDEEISYILRRPPSK